MNLKEIKRARRPREPKPPELHHTLTYYAQF